jgi:hypothetical protein
MTNGNIDFELIFMFTGAVVGVLSQARRNMSPAFDRYIGIDYSGAETPTSINFFAARNARDVIAIRVAPELRSAILGQRFD